jgi:protein-disulfide isomerase
MPSSKQSKRKRRAAKAPPPPPKVGTRRQASPRVLIGAAAVLALIVAAIVLGVVLTSGSDGSSSNTTGARLPDAAEVQTMFAGIPQQGNVLGKSSAPVTMVEYFDLQCPFCQEFETSAMPTLISRYVRSGKVKLEARPIAILGSDSFTGQSAVIAAGMQNKLFNFAQLLYDNQGGENTGWLDDSMVKSVATSIPGLDVDRLLADLDSGEVDKQASAFNDVGVSQTPTLLVGQSGAAPKKVTISSPTDPGSVGAAIDAALG